MSLCYPCLIRFASLPKTMNLWNQIGFVVVFKSKEALSREWMFWAPAVIKRLHQ